MASYRVLTGNASGDIFAGTARGSLQGWSISTTAGCTVNFRDGSSTGAIVASAVVAASSTNNHQLIGGVTFDQGVYVEIASGSVTNLAVYVD